jgi:ABC-type sulfate transport system permease component
MVMISGASSPLYAKRRRRNVITMGLSFAATAFGLSWLVLILGVLLWEGFSGLSLAVFTEMTPPPGAAGGLLNPIIGSLVMTSIAVAIGTPLGMLAGTYMAEYGRYDKLTTVVRFINDILLSAPSIVIGLFVYEIMVAQMGHFSGWAGAVSLAVIVVPVVVRTTEDMLTLVPDTLREAAASIGLPRALMITKVAYRAARAGLTIEEFPQSPANLTAASQNLFELISAGNIVAYPDAAMRLAVSRAVAVETSRGWRISKEKASHKIDVVVALAMSALAAVRSQGAGSYLPYELWVSHDADEVVDVPPPPKRLCPTLSDADFMRITRPPALWPSEAGR